jgi:Contractile injection system tape measure protein
VAFLQRRGALREEESGWRLQPEPESYDVLLGRLPWGLATVKLPWMTRPLYTDWPTP